MNVKSLSSQYLLLVATVALLGAAVLAPLPAIADDEDCTLGCPEEVEPGTIIWYIDINGEELSVDRAETAGLPFYNGVTEWWYSEEAIIDQPFVEDDWNVTLCGFNYGTSGTFTVTVYEVDSSTAIDGTKIAEGQEYISAPALDQNDLFENFCVNITCIDESSTSQLIHDGRRVALKVSYDSEDGFYLVLSSGTFYCSRVQSSSPIPELATIIFVFGGLLFLSGYILLGKRSKRQITAIG